MATCIHGEVLVPADPLREMLAASILSAYVLASIMLLRKLYLLFLRRGFPEPRAVYLVRKLVHVLGGGVVGLLVPLLFSSPLVPFSLSTAIAAALLWLHRSGRLLRWFQVEENMYDVSFALAWGSSLLVLWLLLGSARYAVVPIVFISFGDAATGIARILVVGRRTKHWVGTLAMLGVTVPLGAVYAGLVGVAAAAASSIAEKFEARPIDDNILIALSSTAILVAAGYAGLL